MNARKYINVSNLTNFIQKEVRHEDFHIRQVLEGEPEEQIVTGEVLGPLKPIGREGKALVLRGQNLFYSRFRAGDQVDIGVVNQSNKKFKILSGSSIKFIRFPAPGVLEVLVPGEKIPLEAVDLFLLPKSNSGIKRKLLVKLRELELLGVKGQHYPVNNFVVRQNFAHMSEHLNSTQKDALKFLVENDFMGLIQGPPGTGKTHLLAALINLAISSGMRVGLASLSHAAVDNALARLLKSGLAQSDVVRVASNEQAIKKEQYRDINIYDSWAKTFAEVGGDYALYAATMHTWCMSKSTPHIDLLIIDEASQVPLYFHPFLEKISSRVVMFGDHKQLPPVIQISDHDLPAEDIFTYQINQGKYPMLETQYRMNQWIQEWSANRFYNGKLKADESVRNRDVLSGRSSSKSLLGDKSVNFFGHEGESVNFANSLEAKKVADLVSALKVEGNLPLSEIGIVAPHRAHAGALCAALQQKFDLSEAQNILVDTVERFQGQEREAMIFSIGVDKDNSKKNSKSFLGDGRRLNVAVTRAKSRFYCFAPEKLIDSTLSSQGDNDLKSMLSWCGANVGAHIERINLDGYVTQQFASGHLEYEHRAIAKKLLNRELFDSEEVHHINGRKDDNRIENLCVLDRQNHDRFHEWYNLTKQKESQMPTIRDQLKKLIELDGIFLCESDEENKSKK